MDEVNKVWTRKKKRSKCRHKHPPPPEIKKFLPYPSEKNAKIEWLFQTPSDILVHRGVCTLNGMALTWQVIAFEPYFKSAKNVRSNSRVPQRWVSLFLYLVHFTLTKEMATSNDYYLIRDKDRTSLVSKGVSSANSTWAPPLNLLYE